MLGTVLGARDAVVNKTDKFLSLWNLRFGKRQTVNKGENRWYEIYRDDHLLSYIMSKHWVAHLKLI